MPEASGLLRQWNLLAGLLARSQGATVDELAREQEVSLKTIRRDLVTLRDTGFPLAEALGDFGRKEWRIDSSRGLVPMSFTWEEAISLCLAKRFLEPLAGTHFWTAATYGITKIRAVLGKQALHYLDRMATAFYLTARGSADKYAVKAALCDDLTRAIEERLMTDLTYQSGNATEPASRTVYPLGWAVHNSSLYLVAHAPDHDERRIYKLDRVESALVTRLKFQRPPDFSLDRFLSGAFGIYRGDGQQEITVRVRFLPAVVRAIREKQHHPTQHLTPDRDGSLVAEYRLTALPEFKSWLLSWGANAVVLEPQELIDEMRDEAEKLRRLYEQDESTVRDKQKPRRTKQASRKRSKPGRPR